MIDKLTVAAHESIQDVMQQIAAARASDEITGEVYAVVALVALMRPLPPGFQDPGWILLAETPSEELPPYLSCRRRDFLRHLCMVATAQYSAAMRAALQPPYLTITGLYGIFNGQLLAELARVLSESMQGKAAAIFASEGE